MFPQTAQWMLILIISISTVSGADIPYVFGEDGGKPLEDSSLCIEYNTPEEETIYESPPETVETPLYSNDSDSIEFYYSECEDTEIPLLASFNDSDVIFLSTASGSSESSTASRSRAVSDIKEEINEKVDVDNTITRNAAVVIAAKYPGEYNIDQIGSIYNYLKGGWKYVNDPRGVDYYSSASNTLQLGKDLECLGAGDCDDFAILMSALIESIGGTTRVILAYNENSGHAYTEVYLGQADNNDHHVEEMINWLKSEYDTEKIYTHIDPNNKDVWLNLDWSADHQGGPFWKAEKHRPLLIRENYNKVPPNLPKGMLGLITGSRTSNGLYGKINGQVTKEDGTTLISKIVLTDQDGNHQLAVTDRYGNYEFILEPGTYRLTAEKTGYYFEDISVKLSSGREIAVPIRGEEEYVIDTGITLGDAYAWGDDDSLADYYN